jgi:hypothetical protein
MAYISPNSFYSSFAKKKHGLFSGGYQPPVSDAFAHPKPKPPAAPTAPSAAPSTSPAPTGSPSTPNGFTPYTSSLPPDPAYQLTIGNLDKTQSDTLAGLTQQRGAGLQQYGYTETPGPDGLPQIAFDPHNPYSQAALLRQHYQQAKTGNTTSYAAQGQLYAGSLQNAQNASTDSYNASDNALTNAVIQFLANNTQQQQGAGDAHDYNAGLALGQSVANAPTNPLSSPFSAAKGTTGSLAGSQVSTDKDGNVAYTMSNGYSIVYGPDGKTPLYFLDPKGNRVTS